MSVPNRQRVMRMSAPEAELAYRVLRRPTDPVPGSPLLVRHALIGMRGAVSFTYMDKPSELGPSTEAQLDEVSEELRSILGRPLYPMGVDFATHGASGSDERIPMDCDLLPQRHCWYDGSSMAAMRWMAAFDANGRDDAWLRDRLAAYYFAEFYPDNAE